jgi:hypothetical protein
MPLASTAAEIGDGDSQKPVAESQNRKRSQNRNSTLVVIATFLGKGSERTTMIGVSCLEALSCMKCPFADDARMRKQSDGDQDHLISRMNCELNAFDFDPPCSSIVSDTNFKS